MKTNVLSKISHVSMKIEEIFNSRVFSGEEKVKKLQDGESYVFSFLESSKLYLITNFFVLRDESYDGSYYSYNFDYIPLDSAVNGKRGVKVKKVVMSYSSIKNPSREKVDKDDIIIVGKIKFKHLPEKIKIVEKEGCQV